MYNLSSLVDKDRVNTVSVVGYLHIVWKYITVIGVIKSLMANSLSGRIGQISWQKERKLERNLIVQGDMERNKEIQYGKEVIPHKRI